MSCAGNGYLTGNMLVSFPFEDGQILEWTSMGETAQRFLERCFVDAGVNVSGVEVGWPSIGRFSIRESQMSFCVSVGGSEKSITVSAAASGFPIVSGKAPFGSYVVVVSAEGVRDFIAFCSENSISPPVPGSSSPSGLAGGFLKLCPKCVTRTPVGLTSIRVYDGVNPKGKGPHFVLKGNVLVKPGNNMLLSDPEDNGIQIGAVPGAGLGVVPCLCDDGPVVKSQIMSPDGHTRIFNDTCYDVEPWIETKGSKRIGHLQLHAKCTACCTCAMYESIVNDRLVPLSNAVRQARSDIDEHLSNYESAVKRFNQRLAIPTLSDVRLSLSGMPVGANLSPKLAETGVKGRMERCAFTATLRNSSYSVITATVYSLSGSDVVAEVSASWSDENGVPKSTSGNSASDIVGRSFTVMPGMSLVVAFVSVKNDMVGEASTGGYSGSISVGLSYSSEGDNSGSLGILRKTVEV